MRTPKGNGGKAAFCMRAIRLGKKGGGAEFGCRGEPFLASFLVVSRNREKHSLKSKR